MTNSTDAAVSFEDDGTVSISGSRESLVGLGRALATDTDAVIEVATGMSTPDFGAASTVRIRVDPAEGLAISKEGDNLVLTGHPTALATMADNIMHLGMDPAALGDHIHIEHFPEHPYLRSGSLPLVVSLT